jgi:virulence-associated protein VagC
MALWYIPDDPVCGRSPQIMAWKRLPSDLSLPPDGVLFAAWNSVCHANPAGIPPYAGWSPGNPRISPVSPVETAYPSSRYQAEMPTVALGGQSSAVQVDLPAELAIPGQVLALLNEHGVVVHPRPQPAWAAALQNRASTGGHEDVADEQ